MRSTPLHINNMFTYEIYQAPALLVSFMLLIFAILQSGGNINITMFSVNNYNEDKSITTGNTARIDSNFEEIRAVE